MEFSLLHLRQDKVVNRRLYPGAVGLGHWNVRPNWRFEGPMRTIHRPFLDPCLQFRNLARAHWLGITVCNLWHEVMRIRGFDPFDQFTLLGMSGDDRIGTMLPLPQRRFRKIQAEIRLSHLWIGTMATETSARQDWLHVCVEVQTARSRLTATTKHAAKKGRQKRNYGHRCISIRLVLCLADVLSLRRDGFQADIRTPPVSTLYCDFQGARRKSLFGCAK